MNDKPNFFEKFGLEVGPGKVEVGNVYPIYGMITKLLEEAQDGTIIAEVNHHIEVHLEITDSTKLDLLKEKAFEPGIFVCKIVDNTGPIVAKCSTVIFGKSQNLEV